MNIRYPIYEGVYRILTAKWRETANRRGFYERDYFTGLAREETGNTNGGNTNGSEN